MKVLIDCGAYTGDSLPPLIDFFGPFDRIVCFEANSRLIVQKPNGFQGQFEMLRYAVWHTNTRLRFFFGEHDEQSSLMENKSTGNFSHERSEIVPTIDFAGWIEDNTRPDDRLTVKMDIEGAEFDVLEHLAHHAASDRIENLLVEWHNNRLSPRWRYHLRRKAIEFRYIVKGIPIRIWRKKSFPNAP